MAAGEPDSRRNDFDRYLAANLAGWREGGFELLDFRVEESSIVMIRPLDDISVLKQQILEEMKYRAPLDLTVEVADRFRELGGLFRVFGSAEKEKGHMAGIEARMEELRERNKKIRQMGQRQKQLKETMQRKKAAWPDWRKNMPVATTRSWRKRLRL